MDWPLITTVCRGVALGAAAPGVACCGLGLWRVLRGGRVSLCPGPRRGWVRRAVAPRLVVVRGCRYDLRGLPRGVDGAVMCPECGRVTRSERERVRHGYRWRAGRVGAVLVVLALIAHLVPLVHSTRWQRRVPTTVLIAGKRVLGSALPTRLRRELGRRIDGGGLSEWQKGVLLPALARDLRGDGVRSNAEHAAEALWSFGAIGREQLERSLGSSDYQERQYAADRIRWGWWRRYGRERGMTWWDEGAPDRAEVPVSEALLRVSVEGLCGDGWWDSGGVYNGWDGYRFLEEFPERSRPYVAAGMASADMQQRLLCAGLAARMGDAEMAALAAPILVVHLKDNRYRADAWFAAAGLRRLGEGARGVLEAAADSGDAQQRRCAAALLGALRCGPPRESEEGVREKLFRVLRGLDGQAPPADYALGYGGLWDLE